MTNHKSEILTAWLLVFFFGAGIIFHLYQVFTDPRYHLARNRIIKGLTCSLSSLVIPYIFAKNIV